METAVSSPERITAGPFRRAFKLTLQRLPSRKDAIVVASFGRAGSTLVFEAVSRAMTRARFGTAVDPLFRLFRSDAFGEVPGGLRRGVTYKTHAYPEMLAGQEDVRTIFLFGSAVDAALSVHDQKALRGEAWVRLHFAHLQRPYRYDDLLREDVLGFRDQCIAWMGHDRSPVLCLRYEAIWDHADTLAAFTGLKIALPERRPRAEKAVSPELLESAERVYGAIDADLARLPDCFEAAPSYGAMMRLDGKKGGHPESA